MSISQVLLPEFDQEMSSTRKLLECVPEGKWDYKPHEKSMELGRLAGHIVELPGWAKTIMDVDHLNLDEADMKPFVAASRKELLDAFDKGVREGRAAIAAAGDDHLHKNWSMTFGGQKVVDSPRTEVLRTWCFNHLIHHRAQLGVYLRLNNVAIPGMYGPSADEMAAFQKSGKPA